VVAIEIDPELVARLKQRFEGESRLTVVAGDVLETDLSQWGPAVVAGNLPYYISSPAIDRVLAAGRLLKRAVLLVQAEVADRLAAQPGSRDYGYLSVHAQLFSHPEILFQVPPAAFHPPPKVDSTAVRLEMGNRSEALGVSDAARFLEFVGRCFRHKRKTIRNNLAEIYGKSVVDAWPEASLRAEQLSMEQFAEMYGRVDRGS
jgi:16S rRNA (adenine1518-N6/adenine1519-N6)-dimethyltransferase